MHGDEENKERASGWLVSNEVEAWETKKEGTVTTERGIESKRLGSGGRKCRTDRDASRAARTKREKDQEKKTEKRIDHGVAAANHTKCESQCCMAFPQCFIFPSFLLWRYFCHIRCKPPFSLSSIYYIPYIELFRRPAAQSQALTIRKGTAAWRMIDI